MAVSEASHAAARAVDDLFRKHGSEVYRYALAVLGNHSDAEDVTQTTFLNAYRSLEQGVRPRKPSNWLLAIASNAIKQKFRHESTRPRQVALDVELPETSSEDDGPTIGELLTALSRIPPQQRQAIVLREFEGRSYKEIAAILGVTTSALETLLFRARRSLAEELEHHLTCTQAQLAISRATDGRLGRKERRRLREHIGECADCARFARAQTRHRTALRGLVFLPIPVSLSLFRGFEGTAAAAALPSGTSAAAGTGAALGAAGATGLGATSAAGLGAASATGGGVFAGGVAVKAAAVVGAASVVGGVGVVGSSEISSRNDHAPGRPAMTENGARLGQVAPRGVTVPGKGVARGKATAPGQTKTPAASRSRKPRGSNPGARSGNAAAKARSQGARASVAKKRSAKPAARAKAVSRPAVRPKPAPKPKASATPKPAPKPKTTTPETSAPSSPTPPTSSAGIGSAGTGSMSTGPSTDRGGGKPQG